MDSIIKVNKQLLPIYIDFGKKISSEIQILYEKIQNSSKNIFPEEVSNQFLISMTKIGADPNVLAINFPFVEYTNHVICVSKNNVVAHGFTKEPFNVSRDVVSLDFGVSVKTKDNLKATFDFAFTVGPEKWVKEPLKTLNKILDIQPKNTMEIAKIIESADMKKVAQLTGHGIGEKLHMAPYIYNMTGAFNSVPLIEGMAFCPEPIYARKIHEEDEIEHIYIDENNEIKTISNQASTHWETTMVVYNNKIIDVVGITNLEKEDDL